MSAGHHLRTFRITVRHALVEQTQNRFAMLLVLGFVPSWITLAHLTVPAAPVPIRVHGVAAILTVGSDQISQVVGALSSITTISGFLMFAATFSSGPFDRRLTMAGYSRTHLVLAKFTIMVLASAALAAYAVASLALFWEARHVLALTAALFCDSLTYGAIGVALGAVLRREVEGMFAIAMISTADLFVQNPLYSLNTHQTAAPYLPSFGAVQAATAASFSSTIQPGHLARQLLWFTLIALLGLITFHRCTRSARGRPSPLTSFLRPQLPRLAKGDRALAARSRPAGDAPSLSE